MAPTVVVTGASGFVGLPLCALLARKGVEVRAAVRREYAPLAELAAQSRLRQMIVGDIGDEALDWSAVLAGADTVVHLAARVHVFGAAGTEDRDRFKEINVDAAVRLARAAARARVRRIVFVSSAKAGKEQDPYSRSKCEAERLLREATQASGLECVIVRPPLVYGPRVRANFLRLLRLVDSGIPLPLAGIANRRSLVFVGNLADALHACIAHPSAAGQTFAVSDGEDVSTPELVRRIAGALGRPARLFPFPVALLAVAGRLAGQAQAIGRLTEDLVVDSSPIGSVLGWHPPFSMAQGLAETTAWYRMHRHTADNR
jgi:nucleoside-diphosphate-sugar epimerase